MENLNNIIGYVARDNNGTLAFYTTKPNIKDGVWDILDGYYTLLDNSLFPEIANSEYKTIIDVTFLEGK